MLKKEIKLITNKNQPQKLEFLGIQDDINKILNSKLIREQEKTNKHSVDLMSCFYSEKENESSGYCPPGSEPTLPKGPEEINKEIRNMLEREINISYPEIINNIKLLKKFFSNIDFNYLENRLLKNTDEIKNFLNVFNGKDILPEKDKLTIIFKNISELYLIVDTYKEYITTEADKYFEPLINLARGDVRQYLLKYKNINTNNLNETKEFLNKKYKINIPVLFYFSLNGNGLDKSEKGNTNNKTIKINLDNIEFLENGNIDEAELMSTLVHEILHNVSHEFFGNENNKWDIGLAGNKWFELETQKEGWKKPETYLNEIITELCALDIMKKYYKKESPGKLILKKNDTQYLNGYISMIEDFYKLEDDFPKEIIIMEREMKKGMFEGKFEGLINFFNQNPEIFERIKHICNGNSHLEKLAKQKIKN